MIKTIKQSWKNFSNLGIPSNANRFERLQRRTFNQILLSAFIGLILFLLLIDLPLANYGQLIQGSITLIIFVLSLFFIHKGYHHIVLHFVFILLTLNISFGAFVLQTGIANYLAYFPLVAALYFLMPPRYHGFYVFLLLFLLAAFVVYENYPTLTYDENERSAYSNLILMLFFELIILRFFKIKGQLSEQFTEEKQVALDNAQSLAKVGTWLYDESIDRVVWSNQMYELFEIMPTETERLEVVKALLIKENNALGAYKFKHELVSDNSIKWLKIIGEKEQKTNGNFKYYGYVQDITIAVEDETAIQKLVGDLKRSNQELEQFAYVASHDLQEPLRMVGNFVGLLEEENEEKLDQESKEYIRYIEDGVIRMSALIEDLLQYSRVGRADMKLELVDTKMLVNSKLKDLSLRIKETKTQIEIENLPSQVYCEPNQLGLVFYNLFKNGIKFNKSEMPILKINCIDKGKYYQFSVKDNGIGIDSVNHEKIFKIFKRLHRKEEYKGTGIGLSIVKRIILKHGGDIWLESEKGQGSTFFFTVQKQV